MAQKCHDATRFHPATALYHSFPYDARLDTSSPQKLNSQMGGISSASPTASRLGRSGG
jgi:hypothetical protein